MMEKQENGQGEYGVGRLVLFTFSFIYFIILPPTDSKDTYLDTPLAKLECNGGVKRQYKISSTVGKIKHCLSEGPN